MPRVSRALTACVCSLLLLGACSDATGSRESLAGSWDYVMGPMAMHPADAADKTSCFLTAVLPISGQEGSYALPSRALLTTRCTNPDGSSAFEGTADMPYLGSFGVKGDSVFFVWTPANEHRGRISDDRITGTVTVRSTEDSRILATPPFTMTRR